MLRRIRIEGATALLRAFDQLPDDAQRIVRERSEELARELVDAITVAAQMRGRQAAMAASTVKVEPGNKPVISAGKRGPKKARGVLFGTEFGATRRFGWYSAGRYYNLPNKQFPPHRGSNSYWFYKTIDRNERRIGQAYVEMLDAISQQWGRG